MKFAPGDKIWAEVDCPELGQGELPAIVIDCFGECLCGERIYAIEILNQPEAWHGHERWLRPRHDPPPQDWVKLCNLNDTPVEVPA